VPYVRRLTGEQRSFAGDRGSEFSTGGMKTKLAAVEIARDAGCKVVIAHGREPRVIARLLTGEPIGTLFDAEGALKNRVRWLKNSQPKGSVSVDEGALAAMKAHKSLLPRGVVDVEGDFGRDSVILVNGKVKLITNFSSAELSTIKGKKTEDVEALLGSGCPHVVARPEETAFLED